MGKAAQVSRDFFGSRNEAPAVSPFAYNRACCPYNGVGALTIPMRASWASTPFQAALGTIPFNRLALPKARDDTAFGTCLMGFVLRH